MNVGTIKTVSYLASVGLLAALVHQGYEYFTKDHKQMQEGSDPSRIYDVLNSVEQPEAPRIVGLDYHNTILPAIRKFDWTGKPPVVVVEEPEGTGGPEVEPDDIPVSDIASVLAVIERSINVGESFALIALKPGPSGQVLPPSYYYVGDSLPKPNDHISVFALREGGVEFSFANDDREHEFLMPPTKFDNSLIVQRDSLADIKRAPDRLDGPGIVETPRGANSNAPARTVRKNGIYDIGTEDMAEFEENYDNILSGIDSETYRDPQTGERAGVRIRSVPAGGIASRHGVQDGDILISINGTSVTSEQEAMQYVRQNGDNYSTWEVRYIRLGVERTEIYRSPQD